MSAKFLDPVYAAYLVHRGCQLKEVKHSHNYKHYYFEDNAAKSPYEEEFYGVGSKPKKVTFKTFVLTLNHIMLLEDVLIRKSSDRYLYTGCDARSNRASFVTTDQAIAACLLYKGCQCWDVREIGKGDKYKFYFDDVKETQSTFIETMTSQVMVPWIKLKWAWKQATCIRKNRIEHRNDHQNEHNMERKTIGPN